MRRLDELGVTSRECEVLELIRERLTNKEIADRLFISVRTVESHVSSLMAKMGTKDRIELAVLASQMTEHEPRHNLPHRPASFVGRESELAALQKLISGSRLVTVVGPAGVGKTRLALEAGWVMLDDHPDGVWLVSLASLQDSDLVPQEAMSVLRCPAVSELSMIESLTRCLETMRCLLVLDNCEHLAPEVSIVVDEITSHTESARVLATSRQPLGLPGEAVFELAPLLVPSDDADRVVLLHSGATRLFAERAEAARTGFRITDSNSRHVVSICRHLDGLPLALELAASSIRSFSPAQLDERLDDRFRILKSARPEDRHRTLEAAIEWSYELLGAGEQLLLCRLSVFAGTFSLTAAESVCANDILPRESLAEMFSGLVDKSLVVTEESGRVYRYRLLESIRWFGWQRLEEKDDMIQKLLEVLGVLATEAEGEMKSSGQRKWLDLLNDELPNIRRVLEWTIEKGEAENALDLLSRLELFWIYADLRREGISWTIRVLERFPDAPSLPRLKTMITGSRLLEPSDTSKAIRLAEQALALSKDVDRHWEMQARLALGSALSYSRSRSDEARRHLEAAARFFGASGDRWTYAHSKLQLANFHDTDQATKDLEEAASYFSQSGDRIQYGNVLYMSASKLMRLAGGELDRARSWARQALEVAQELGSEHEEAHARSLQGILDFRTGNKSGLTSLLDSCLAVFRRVGDALHGADLLFQGTSRQSGRGVRRGERLVRGRDHSGAASQRYGHSRGVPGCARLHGCRRRSCAVARRSAGSARSSGCHHECLGIFLRRPPRGTSGAVG